MNTMNTPRAEDEARREIETYLAILETKGWDVYTVTKDGTRAAYLTPPDGDAPIVFLATSFIDLLQTLTSPYLSIQRAATQQAINYKLHQMQRDSQ